MCGENQTRITRLTLLGFGNLVKMNTLIFVFFLIIYTITLIGNILIITLIRISPKLHSPMYFFLANLSMCEILLTSLIMPNILYVVWGNGGSVSLNFCIVQFYFCASIGAAETLFLTVMAYDRYLAICNPLRYTSLMNAGTQNFLTLTAWILGFLVMTTSTSEISMLQFCQSDRVDHLFCDVKPILELSSTSTYLVEMEALIITVFLCLFPFLIIMASYASIFAAIFRISSSNRRRKTFATCSSHLASVCLYFGTLFVIYFVPSQLYSRKFNKYISLAYTLVTPLANPFIYSLRNHEMKASLRSLL